MEGALDVANGVDGPASAATTSKVLPGVVLGSSSGGVELG